MSESSENKSFLDRISSFSIILTMVILMVVGLGLTPLLDVAQKPRVEEGAKMSINFRWPNSSPKAVEQEVTSKLEGMLAAINGVQSITSASYMGRGYIGIVLKPEANEPSVRFEISSLIRQIYKKLPEDVTYPTLSGGRKSDDMNDFESINLLNYRINSQMDGENLKEYVDQNIIPALTAIDEVDNVWVSGGASHYMEITYDPMVLANYKLTASTLYDGVMSFIGKNNVVGDVEVTSEYGARERMTLLLVTANTHKQLGDIPLIKVGTKIIYLNDLATCEYKEREPTNYYRINGLNTLNMTIAVDPDANIISLSKRLRKVIEELEPNLSDDVHLELAYDASEEVEIELNKLVTRISLSLLILMVFVWFVSRNWKYLSIISITLLANVLIAIILYYLLNIRLHVFSMAGIAVSFGIIIDSTIVMVDHYSYYRNRKAFLAILAALLTTIGSLIVVFFMPDVIKKDLYDFSRIIIINLSVALLVALVFVPALVGSMSLYRRQDVAKPSKARWLLKWNRFYGAFINFTQKKRWIYMVVLLFLFGLPIYTLPEEWVVEPDVKRERKIKKMDAPWYETAYNESFGSEYYIIEVKPYVDMIFGGTMRLFAEALSSGTYYREEQDIMLTIRGQMPTGATPFQLNEKVVEIEQFLWGFDEISRFETKINSWGASVVVEFEEEYQESDFPIYLENEVVALLISLGGADWSTKGVSDEGFSNSINLSSRNNRITISGYSYNQLYKYAQMLSDYLKNNPRVVDLAIENNGRARAEDELFVDFDMEYISSNQVNLRNTHRGLSEIVKNTKVGWYTNPTVNTWIELRSTQRDLFDLWRVENSHVKVGDSEVRISGVGEITKRTSKNSIPKKDQEYVLSVAYNFMGDRNLGRDLTKDAIEYFNENVPIGFRAKNNTRGWYDDDGTQYWLLLLVVVIIFFICSILFESFVQPVVIISLIPVSFIGTFLTFHWAGVNFGTGGLASLVMLSGLVVNAAIYLLNEYNNISQNCMPSHRVKLYLKAYNHKVIPVFLTVVSTILGLIPFLMDGPKETFWFPFALGTTGGLLFSVFALVFIMPIFMPFGSQKRRKPLPKTNF